MSRYWTTSEIETVKRMRANGESINAMCAELDRSYASVASKLCDAGVSRKKTPWTEQQMRTLMSRKWSSDFKAASDAVGHTPSSCMYKYYQLLSEGRYLHA